MIIRPLREGDEEQVRDLFRECFGKEMSAETWTWKYRHSYLGSAAAVAEDNGRIVSHYGGLKMRLFRDGSTYDAFQGCDAMTHPAFQSRGIIVQTARGFYSANPEREFMFGFPSERHAILSARWLGWQRHVHINEMVKKVRGGGFSTSLLRIEEGWDRVTAGELDSLWEEAAGPGGYVLEKRSDYLFWRFRDNPEKKYEIVVFRGVFRKKIRACAVLRAQGDELRVLDLIAPVRMNVRKLMKCLEERAAGKGLRAVRLWSNPNGMRCGELKDAGYREEKGIPFALRVFEGSTLDSAPFLEHYHYAMGDYDAA